MMPATTDRDSIEHQAHMISSAPPCKTSAPPALILLWKARGTFIFPIKKLAAYAVMLNMAVEY